MKISAAIPFTHNRTESLNLKATLASLKAHGFDEVVMMLLDNGKPPQPDEAFMTLILRVHPDFVVEAALSEVQADWVFIVHPGELLTGVDGHTVREELELPQNASKASASLQVEAGQTGGGDSPAVQLYEPEVRGFSKANIPHDGQVGLNVIVHTNGRVAEPYARPVFKPELPVSVILPTWRLGGYDVTLGALAAQTTRDFEVIVIDALHLWRAKGVAEALNALPFPVKHLAVENSIFPVSSHARFRNTGIRAAKGRRLIFLNEYAVPPPNFIAAHTGLNPQTIGLSTWVRTALHPDSIAPGCRHSATYKLDNVWDVIEEARAGKFLWSTFKADVAPLAMALEYEQANGLVPPKFPRMLGEHDAAFTLEYLHHWKCDSVDTALVHHINGWDENFDGNGGYADTDFALRLHWTGATTKVIPPEVRVLDPHELSVAPIRDITRNNYQKLLDVRKRRTMRCTYGLVHGLVND